MALAYFTNPSNESRADLITFLIRLPDPEDTSPRKAEEIPPQEIANAAEWILQRQISLPKEDLVRETARLFGIQRMGNKVISSMESGIEILSKRNRCELNNAMVTLSS